MSDLDVLFPQGKDVTIGEETIKIVPFPFGNLPVVAKHFAPVTEAFMTSGLITFASGEGGAAEIQVAADWPLRAVEAIGLGGEDLMQLIAICSGKSRDWLNTIGVSEGILLIRAIVEVNRDYFAKKVLPTIPALKV